MSRELTAVIGTTGLTLTCTPYLAGAAQSPISMTELGTTGVYQGNMTGSAGTYELVFIASSVTRAGGSIIWDGTAEVTVNAANVTKVSGTAQTARDIGASVIAASVTAGVTLAASQHVIVDSGTVTNLTNAPTNGDLTATMKASVTTAATAATPTAAAVTADVGITQAGADKVWGSTARTLTSFGTLVADAATAVWSAGTRVLTAGTNIVLAKGVGLTGLNDIAATAVVSAGAITTSAGKVSEVALVDTLTTYTGNTVQTGDAFGRIGANGAGLTDVGFTQGAADKVWSSATRTLTSFGTLVADAAAAVWGAATRVLTAGTNIVLEKGTGLTGLNDIAETSIVSAGPITTNTGKVAHVTLVDTATNLTNAPTVGDLTDAMKVSVTVAATAATPTVTATVSAPDIRAAIGMATANLDAQLATLPTEIVTGGPIDTTDGSVANVLLVDVTTLNSDMRGTDGANTIAPDNASILIIKGHTNNIPNDVLDEPL